jgi:DNA-binding response OmpR family regulator
MIVRMPARSAVRRILLIEDKPDTAQSLLSLLRSMGHMVELAINGEAAREIARRSTVDMVLLDVLLPDCNGWDLAREFRGELGLQIAPIVALSDSASEADKRRSFDSGCDYHLVKPLNLQYLQNLIAQI